MSRALSHLLAWRNAIADSDLPGVTKGVAWALSLSMNSSGGSAFPSTETLMRRSGWKKRAVQNALDQLDAGGWLEVAPRFDERGGQLSSSYQATFPALSTGGAPDAPGGRTTCIPGVHGGGAPHAPEIEKRMKTSLEDGSRPGYVPAAADGGRLERVPAPPVRLEDDGSEHHALCDCITCQVRRLAAAQRCYPTSTHPVFRGRAGYTDIRGFWHSPACTPATCELLGLVDVELAQKAHAVTDG